MMAVIVAALAIVIAEIEAPAMTQQACQLARNHPDIGPPVAGLVLCRIELRDVLARQAAEILRAPQLPVEHILLLFEALHGVIFEAPALVVRQNGGALLNGGHVEQVGTPLELYERPASRFVAGFIGSPRMNFIAGEPAAARGAAEYGIRPEHLSLSSEGRGWPGRVLLTEDLGSDTYVHVESAQSETPLVVRTPGQMRIGAGDTVCVAPDESRAHLFDAEGRPFARAPEAE